MNHYQEKGGWCIDASIKREHSIAARNVLFCLAFPFDVVND